MKRKLLALLLTVATIAALPLGVHALTEQDSAVYNNKDVFKAQISADQITVSGRSIRIAVDELTVTNIIRVVMDDEVLFPRHHYSAKKDTDTGELVVTFTSSFLQRQELGKHNVRVVFYEHSAETDYEVTETDGGTTTTPPRTNDADPTVRGYRDYVDIPPRTRA